MTTIRPGDAGLVRTVTTDVRPDAVADVVARLVGACEAVAAAEDGGLLASTVLVSRAAPGPEDAAVRVVHLARWTTAGHAAALAIDADPDEVLVGRAEHDLDLRSMLVAGAEQRLDLGAHGPATFLIAMDSDPGEHEGLVGFNARDTEEMFTPMPGFVGCTIFGDHRRERVFEVVQWQSVGHFAAAAASPGFAEHNAVLDGLCRTIDARAYDVVHTIEEK